MVAKGRLKWRDGRLQRKIAISGCDFTWSLSKLQFMYYVKLTPKLNKNSRSNLTKNAQQLTTQNCHAKSSFQHIEIIHIKIFVHVAAMKLCQLISNTNKGTLKSHEIPYITHHSACAVPPVPYVYRVYLYMQCLHMQMYMYMCKHCTLSQVDT